MSGLSLKQIQCEGVDRIHLALDSIQYQAVMNMIINLWVPQKAGDFFTGWETISI